MKIIVINVKVDLADVCKISSFLEKLFNFEAYFESKQR
jgi:hypothetical protein